MKRRRRETAAIHNGEKIEVLDHIILGRRTDDRPKDYSSLRELGYFFAGCELFTIRERALRIGLLAAPVRRTLAQMSGKDSLWRKMESP